MGVSRIKKRQVTLQSAVIFLRWTPCFLAPKVKLVAYTKLHAASVPVSDVLALEHVHGEQEPHYLGRACCGSLYQVPRVF